MKEETLALLKRQASIRNAEKTMSDGDLDFAASRAMFYVAEALLGEKDLKFSKHGGVMEVFHTSSKRAILTQSINIGWFPLSISECWATTP